jgi:hypothetical protein
MKYLIIFLFFFIQKINCQTIFEFSKIETTTNKISSIEETNGKIEISADTTEINIHIGGTIIKEKIGSIYSIVNDRTYSVIIYEQDNENIIIFHLEKGKIFCIVFQDQNYNTLEFKK